MWELAASDKRARCTLRFMHQFLHCPQQHGRGALVSRLPAKAQEDHTLSGPRFYWENQPATGRDQPAASSQSQLRQLNSDSCNYRTRNTQTSFTTLYPSLAWPSWRQLPYMLCWQVDCWKSWRLTFALPAPNRSGFVCVPEQRASRPHGEGPERQARGLDFEANHDKGQAPAWLRQRSLLFDLWAGNTHHYPIQFLCYPWCPRHSNH